MVGIKELERVSGMGFHHTGTANRGCAPLQYPFLSYYNEAQRLLLLRHSHCKLWDILRLI